MIIYCKRVKEMEPSPVGDRGEMRVIVEGFRGFGGDLTHFGTEALDYLPEAVLSAYLRSNGYCVFDPGEPEFAEGWMAEHGYEVRKKEGER